MAKLFTFRPDTNLSCLSQHKFRRSSNKRFLKPSSSPCLLNSRSLKVSCSIREKENIAENERISPIVTGLKVDDELGEKPGIGIEKLGLENLSWPPWKNVPQRYKLIGTTSLAFVICNMDKVNSIFRISNFSFLFADDHLRSCTKKLLIFHKLNPKTEFLVGKLEYSHYPNVASVWMEFIGCRISAIIILLGIRFESVTRWLAFKNIWWEVSL